MRNIQISWADSKYEDRDFEIVERKGAGHPDTLADALGEHLSVQYAKLTKEKFGAVLHHNFDKVGIMGGRAEVSFQGGRMNSPIRVLLNGRASTKFGDESLDVNALITEWSKSFFAERYPMLDVQKDLRFLYEVSAGGSPGAVEEKKSSRHYWFEPRSLDDISELKFLACNDTSLGTAFASNSKTERLVLEIESYLQSPGFKSERPWVGNDIKIMCTRLRKQIFMTIAFPQICAHVKDLAEYKRNIEEIVDICHRMQNAICPEYEFSLSVNTRDKYDKLELYLTFTGSSMETGDEGFVGRGNRIGGLITPCRMYTMEGISGKNPVYHTGKMYCVAAHDMALRLFDELHCNTEIALIGQSGTSLKDPWKTLVKVEKNGAGENQILDLIHHSLDEIPLLTQKILSSQFVLA